MGTIFVDTSALFALVNSSDEDNQIAWHTWKECIGGGDEFITSNYMIVESIALIQSRLGIPVMRRLLENLVPFIQVAWLDEEQHAAAIDDLLATNLRNLSLVDCASFNTMRRLDIKTVFTFDEHFREQGFNVIP
jgi:predicted nucleic acid-binding protein